MIRAFVRELCEVKTPDRKCGREFFVRNLHLTGGIVWNSTALEDFAVKHELNLCLLGGDMRQAHLARLLSEDGHRVHTFALDQAVTPTPQLSLESDLTLLSLADAVILPMPVSGEGGLLFAPLGTEQVPLLNVLDALSPGQFICGGRVDPATDALAQERGLSLHDYYTREELVVANCVPTAEGCIQLAMEHLPITIHNARVLVIGYGRLGRVTAQRFGALGAKVTVAARKYDQLAWARSEGFGTEHSGQLAGWLCSYDLVVNTVPALVLGETELADLHPDCLVIDLASKPGGVDFQTAQRLNRKVIWALALPGKVAPVTAGAIIKLTIYHMLHERGF